MDSVTVTRNAPALIWPSGLVIAHAVLQMLDLATTYLALQAGGFEANPLSRMLIENGWWQYAAVKVVVAGAFLALGPIIKAMPARERRFTATTMVAFGAFMAFVVINNALIAF